MLGAVIRGAHFRLLSPPSSLSLLSLLARIPHLLDLLRRSEQAEQPPPQKRRGFVQKNTPGKEKRWWRMPRNGEKREGRRDPLARKVGLGGEERGAFFYTFP